MRPGPHVLPNGESLVHKGTSAFPGSDYPHHGGTAGRQPTNHTGQQPAWQQLAISAAKRLGLRHRELEETRFRVTPFPPSHGAVTDPPRRLTLSCAARGSEKHGQRRRQLRRQRCRCRGGLGALGASTHGRCHDGAVRSSSWCHDGAIRSGCCRVGLAFHRDAPFQIKVAFHRAAHLRARCHARVEEDAVADEQRLIRSRRREEEVEHSRRRQRWPWRQGTARRRWRLGAACNKLEHQARLRRVALEGSVPQVVVHHDDRARGARERVRHRCPRCHLLRKVRDMSSAVVLAVRVATIVLRAWEQLGRTHREARRLWIVHDHQPVRLVLPAARPRRALVRVDVPHCRFRPALSKVCTAMRMQAVATAN